MSKQESLYEVKLCWCCGVPLEMCTESRIPLVQINIRVFRARVLKLFGPQGMPSCGMTDAGKIGNEGQGAKTVYIGGSE